MMVYCNQIKQKFRQLLIVLPLVFYSCNGPLNKTYSRATFTEDIAEIRQGNKVIDEDMELLVKYILICKLSGKNLEGETYKDILDEVKAFHKSNQSLIDRQKNKDDAKRQRLEKLLNVAVTEKGFTKIKNQNFFTYTVIFKNLSPYNITTVIGSLRFNDLLEKEIKKVDVLLEEPLMSGITFKKTFLTDYDQMNQSDHRMRSKALIDMRVEWNPEKIICKDGKVVD